VTNRDPPCQSDREGRVTYCGELPVGASGFQGPTAVLKPRVVECYAAQRLEDSDS
jgi:hypothetical protein